MKPNNVTIPVSSKRLSSISVGQKSPQHESTQASQHLWLLDYLHRFLKRPGASSV
jgi:hypothetical protein